MLSSRTAEIELSSAVLRGNRKRFIFDSNERSNQKMVMVVASPDSLSSIFAISFNSQNLCVCRAVSDSADILQLTVVGSADCLVGI